MFAILAERGIAPPIHGLLPGVGRIEGWIRHSRSLRTEELSSPAAISAVAKCLADFHSVTLPIDKSGTWLEQVLRTSLAGALSQRLSDGRKQEMLDKLRRVRDLSADVEWFLAQIATRNLEVSVCHNDAQEGNIMFTAEGEYRLIDFEYCGYNFSAFDIANAFHEWVFCYNVQDAPFFWYKPELYPSKAQQDAFLQRYLAARGRSSDATSVSALLADIKLCAPGPSLVWGLWAIVNSSSDIEFGYLEFATECFREFDRLKGKAVHA